MPDRTGFHRSGKDDVDFAALPDTEKRMMQIFQANANPSILHPALKTVSAV